MPKLLENIGEMAGSSNSMNLTSESLTEPHQTPADRGLHNPILYVNIIN